MEELKSSSNISILHVFDTIYSADSVEWCPHKPCQHMFVCANYQLDDTAKSSESTSEKCKRFGKIRLFSINKSGQLTLHQTIDTEAVLDQKWCHNQINGHSILGVVTAKNRLEIYKLDPELPELQLVTRIENEDSEVLMLSLDWSTGKYATNEPTIVTSDSNGSINLFDFKDNKLIRGTCWNAHSFEAWICAFYYWDTSVIFTGGDDCKLVKYDLRVGPTPLLKSNAHSAGVTCLHSNREKEHILASGSYDSNLLLWDIRYMKRPVSSTEMPGTVWRVKWNPRDYNHLLVACMRGGFHIVDATNLETPEIVVNYYEHKDLAYGSDWSFLSESEVREYSSESNHIIAACSFYDHKMSVATVDLKNNE